MNEKVITPLPFFKAVKQIILFYLPVLKHTFWLVVCASLLQAIIPAITPENPTVGLAVSILGLLALMFFYGWILIHADNLYLQKNTSMHDALQQVKKRYINLMGAVFLFLILGLIFSGLIFALHRLGVLFSMELLTFLISMFIMIYILVLLAFTLPAILLDGATISRGFINSVKLVSGHWWRTFGIMAIFIIPVILLSVAVVLLPTRNLIAITLYETIYHIITYPLLIALTIVLYHDLKLRHQKEAFRELSHSNEKSI